MKRGCNGYVHAGQRAGETWFGPDALERNLVDELITSDDVLLQKFDQVKRPAQISRKSVAKKPQINGR